MYMVTDGKNKLIYRAAEDRYFFFDHIPEEHECYDEAKPVVREMKALLDDYMNSDVNKARSSVTYEKVTKTHPHYPGRMDHTYLHEQETAAIPKEYKIDLD